MMRSRRFVELAKRNADEASRRARFARIRLLNEELDTLAADAAERSNSVTNKASFLAVSAGVLVAASTAQLWTHAEEFGVAGLGLACLGLVFAAIALRPGKRLGVQAQRLVDRHLDCQHSASEVEAELVKDKARVITAREHDISNRAAWVWSGFGSLAISVASITVVFSSQVLGG